MRTGPGSPAVTRVGSGVTTTTPRAGNACPAPLQMVRSLHFSLGDTPSTADPLHAEKPHVTFPLFRAMDYFVATPDGKSPRYGAVDICIYL